MTTVTTKSPMKRSSYQMNLWSQSGAASFSHGSTASICNVGLGRFHGPPPVPC